MSARNGTTPATYKAFLDGTYLLDLKAGANALKKGAALSSVYGSSVNADKFNVANGVYKAAQKVDTYIDPTVTAAAMK